MYMYMHVYMCTQIHRGQNEYAACTCTRKCKYICSLIVYGLMKVMPVRVHVHVHCTCFVQLHGQHIVMKQHAALKLNPLFSSSTISK